MHWTHTIKKTVILSIISLTVLSSHAASADNAVTHPRKKVLILNSYHKGLSWTDNVVRGIEAELKTKKHEVEIYSEYMDTKRYPGEEYYRQLYETYSYKFKKYKFDIVIVSDNNALNFAIKHHKKLFPDTPVVFCGINNFQESILTGLSLFTGVVEEIDLKGTLELSLLLHPDADRVVSINYETTTGIAVKNEVLEIAPLFEGRVKFEFIEDFNIAELKERVWKLPRNSIILLSVVNRDRSGQFLAYEESIAHIYSEASAPIYSFWDTYLGKGIVGGRLTNGYHQGKTAAQIALRILNGADVKTIPVVRDSPNKYMFDHQQPPGSLRRREAQVVDLPTRPGRRQPELVGTDVQALPLKGAQTERRS